MQEKKARTSNADRTANMRARLIAAARALFVEKGFAETSTPEVVRSAGVTRGALYHHFEDKEALFEAVVSVESEAVAQDIDKAATVTTDDPLLAGASAFFAAMGVPGRARLMLVDGPSVLGHGKMDDIIAIHGRRTLQEGLAAARPDLDAARLDALSAVLSAAFDRAALDIANGAAEAPYLEMLADLMQKAGTP